jgi:drug/metabolite transporter (DMT)-like permease
MKVPMKPIHLLCMLALSAIWGASFLFMRIAVPQLGPLNTTFFRVLFSSLTLLAILLLLRTNWRIDGKMRTALLLGTLNAGIPFLMFSLAAQVLPAAYLAVFNATTPFMGALFGTLFFGEKLTRRKTLGLLLGIVGVAILTHTGPIAMDNLATWSAVAACLLATSCYGLSSFLTKQLILDRGGMDSKLMAFASQSGATLLLLPFFAIAAVLPGNPLHEHTLNVTPGAWLALLGLGLICSALAYILFFRLIADIGPVKSLTVTFLIPVFGILWGRLFLGEPLSWAYAGGGVLIGTALLLVLRPEH